MCGGVVAEEVVDGGGQLEGALVAVPLHGRDPLRVEDPGAHHPGRLLGQAPHAGTGRVGRVTEPRLWLGAGQGPDGRDHAAVVLEVVVGVEDVVLTVVLVLDRHLDGGEAAAHGAGRRHAHAGAAVAVAAPRLVDRGQVVVGAPVARLQKRQDARPVGPGLGPEDARVATEAGQSHGVVQEGDQMREGVAEEPGDAEDDVHPRTPELLVGHQLDAGHAA